jgi:hypothetical protein
MNVDPIAIKAEVIGYRLNADDVIPTAHEEVAFPRLNLASIRIDSLKKYRSRSSGQKSEKIGTNRNHGACRPNSRKLLVGRWANGDERRRYFHQ